MGKSHNEILPNLKFNGSDIERVDIKYFGVHFAQVES